MNNLVPVLDLQYSLVCLLMPREIILLLASLFTEKIVKFICSFADLPSCLRKFEKCFMLIAVMVTMSSAILGNYF